MLPFNSVPWYPDWLRELKEEAWVGPAVVVLLLSGLVAVARRRVPWPKESGARWLVIALLWALFSTGLNSLSAAATGLTLKGRGLDKFGMQAAVFAFVAMFTGACYWALRGEPSLALLRWSRRMVLWSLLVPLAVAALEGLQIVLGVSWWTDVLRMVSEFVHRKVEYEARVRSVSGEASWFGIWLGFVLPWLVSKAVKLRPLALGGVGVAAAASAFTFSRFAWAVTVLVCIGFAFSRVGKKRRGMLGAVAVAFLILGVMAAGAVASNDRVAELLTSFTQETRYWVSNVSRLGMQAAAINMALAHPVVGVGLGGFGFQAREFVPDWALTSPEVQEYLTDSGDTPWPPVHGLWARLAAETGLVGLALFLASWAAFLRAAWRLARYSARRGDGELRDLWMAVFWSGVNCLLVGFAFDSFRFGGYWLLLGVGWAAMASEDGGSGKRGETGVA